MNNRITFIALITGVFLGLGQTAMAIPPPPPAPVPEAGSSALLMCISLLAAAAGRAFLRRKKD